MTNPPTKRTQRLDDTRVELPVELDARVSSCIEDWVSGGLAKRLWAGDATLWTGRGEDQWLGWLGLTKDSAERAETYQEIAQWTRASGFRHAVVLGMGGSSLCPEVLRLTFGALDGFPELHVLDSTDPAQVRSLEARLDLPRTLFIVSSKSGSTLEPNIFKDYFYRRLQEVLGTPTVGGHFIAVTDPGSALEAAAKQHGFAHIYPGIASVGGRYSALSNFGMVPAAVMGVDVGDFLARADQMAAATSPSVPEDANPGVRLGCLLGVAAKLGRDKLTIVASPRIHDVGAWLEQLIAESTGKQGKGIIPVDREALGAPNLYGDDRIFVYLELEGEADTEADAALEKLVNAGHPVVYIRLADVSDLGQEFFRWEVATAVAGAVLGINPFDQPDVEASKIATRALTTAYEEQGHFPEERALLTADELELFTDEANASALGNPDSLADAVMAHIDRLEVGDYFAILSYVEMNEAHEKRLQSIRHRVRDSKHVATCLGFGPRFLHSTGQAYKGGPDSGVFLQITCDDRVDVDVPGAGYTFGVVKTAQAQGDFQVLVERGRRAIRLNLGDNVARGLTELESIIEKALA